MDFTKILHVHPAYIHIYLEVFTTTPSDSNNALNCLDTVGWETGRACKN